MAHESYNSQIAVLEMNGQSVPQRWASMREGLNTARRRWWGSAAAWRCSTFTRWTERTLAMTSVVNDKGQESALTRSIGYVLCLSGAMSNSERNGHPRWPVIIASCPQPTRHPSVAATSVFTYRNERLRTGKKKQAKLPSVDRNIAVQGSSIKCWFTPCTDLCSRCLLSSHEAVVYIIMPRPWVGGIKRWCASDVCLSDFWRLSVAYVGPKSKTESSRKTKIGTEVAHVTFDSDTTFEVKGGAMSTRRGQLAGGGGILWRPSTQCNFRYEN